MFSSVYHKDNPGVYTSVNTPYILAYSVIMLNVDLHSTTIPQKKKMKMDMFTKNNLISC